MPSHATSPPTPLPVADARPRVGRRLFWFAAFVIVFSGLRAAMALAYMRTQAIESGERLTKSFAHVIAEQTTRTFQTIDQRLQLTATSLAQLESTGRLNELSARELLREQIKELPFVRAVSVSDAQGRVTYSTDPGSVGVSLAQRAYFQIYLTEPETGFYIGPPVRGQASGVWLISAARPLRSKDGAFAGVIMAAAEPPYFDKLWRTVDLGPGGAIALFRPDGVLMMRSPFDDAAMGKAFPSLPVFREWLLRGSAGAFQTVSAFDGQRRISGIGPCPPSPSWWWSSGSPTTWCWLPGGSSSDQRSGPGRPPPSSSSPSAYSSTGRGSREGARRRGSSRWRSGSPSPPTRPRSASGIGTSRPTSGAPPPPISPCSATNLRRVLILAKHGSSASTPRTRTPFWRRSRKRWPAQKAPTTTKHDCVMPTERIDG